MNHKHLFYFWKVAKLGSIVRAAEAISVTPQTLSGQIGLLEESLGTALFSRQGRNLVLTEAGMMALEYADEMFTLSAELEAMIKHHPKGRPSELRVGVSDAVPKSLVFQLLRPAVTGSDPVRIVCREWRLDRLLAELSVHRLDLVISDQPISTSATVRAYNHRLLESGITFLASASMVPTMTTMPFPGILGVLPLLLPGDDSGLRIALQAWFEKQKIRPRIAGEFDDGALMVAFGNSGIGAFPVPSVIEHEFTADRNIQIVGRTHQVKVNYYAISVERRLTHPCVLAITESAQRFSAA